MNQPIATDRAAAAVLAVARRARAEANAAEAQVLASAVEWAHLHLVSEVDEASTWLVEHGRDTGIPIAGEGAPLVSEFAVLEFASVLGVSAEAGRNLVGQALELAHRLPKLWHRVQTGSLAPWRARRIAEATLTLSWEAATFVDAQLAPYAHKTGPAQTQRLVEEAIARYMPEHAAKERERAAEQRYFSIDHDQVSFAGTSRVHGELDLADALDLEDAVRRGAEQLKSLGNGESLDVRRSLAVGMIARGETALEYGDAVVSAGSTTPQTAGSTTPETGGFEARSARTSTTERTEGFEARCARTSTTERSVVLFVHLSADALRTGDPDAPAWLENAGGQLVTAGQVAQWCGGSTGSTSAPRVIVKPVIDLNETIRCTGYQPSDRLTDQVRQRDRTCVFPWCHRRAASCDLDHIVPWEQGGPTASWNLAVLCRKHHRLKTHGGWSYSMTRPGVFLWRSPYGQTWLRDQSGTTDLTPPDTDPPDADPPPRRTS